MAFLDGLRLALTQIRAQRLQSFFAIIGVFVGAMFLIVVVSVITGLNGYMEDDFARRVYGLHTLSLRQRPSVQINPSPADRRGWARRPPITLADAQVLERRLQTPVTVGVQIYGRGTLQGSDGAVIDNVMLAAVSPEYFTIRRTEPQIGRVFTPMEDRLGLPLVLLGWGAADELFAGRDPIGKPVKIHGRPFEVIGVLPKEGTLFGMSLDNRAIAPIGSPLPRVLRPHGELSEIEIKAIDAYGLAAARAEVEAIMRERHRLEPGQPNDFEMETADDSLAFWSSISRVLLLAFPLLVGLAFVVGAMVIMNIMLVSVTERTREIGMRKAVGARRRDIALQVLIESATLSIFGVLCGILVGQGLAIAVRVASPLPTAIAPLWVAAAAIMGIGVGVLAGLYPAIRAARLDPIVALRAE